MGLKFSPRTLQPRRLRDELDCMHGERAGFEFRQTSVAEEPANLGVTRISPAAVQVATGLRAELPRIGDDDTRLFVEEAIKCYEAELYRSAIIMSWLAAVDVLHNFVHQKTPSRVQCRG